MRKTIRLTGRKQLAQSAFEFRFSEVNGRQVGTLAVADLAALKSFQVDSEIRVKISENKLVRILRFGTVGRPVTVCDVDSGTFRAPSCQVRIVDRSKDKDGLLLGSTNTWTLSSAGDPDGILLFQPAAIAPRLWKLDIRDQDKPVLYIDEKIPDAALWAKTDPIFAACVLPAVIAELMGVILDSDEPPESGWESDWMKWADDFMPGGVPPYKGSAQEQKAWIDELVGAFAARHNLSGNVLQNLATTGEKAQP
ncbi:hypothetical protein [Devosia sp.]|uniref:hypothetical protein n=1 Tax=Devosia sp. TaxID=1871048 RepID=UPI003BACF53E